MQLRWSIARWPASHSAAASRTHAPFPVAGTSPIEQLLQLLDPAIATCVASHFVQLESFVCPTAPEDDPASQVPVHELASSCPGAFAKRPPGHGEQSESALFPVRLSP